MSTPDCLEAPSTQRVHQPFRSGKYWVAGFLQGGRLRPASSLKASTCTGCHIRLVPLPIGPSFWTDPVYESCPGAEDQLVPQWNEPGSMGEASARLSVGPRQLIQGGYIWSPRRLRTC